MDSNVEAVTAGIDWLTMTLPVEKATGEIWQEQCLAVLDDIAKEGYELKYRTLQGYYGVGAGNCFVGQRDDGYMVQLTGVHANRHFIRVFRQDAHYSRIDVQCTIKYKEMPSDIAKRAYAYGEISNSRLSGARRRKLLLLVGSDGGDTCYIGSPSSEQQCRIYNKERQSEDISYQRCWRFEVVYKNSLSTRLAQSIPHQVSERAQWSEEVVYSWLKARGIDELWPRDSKLVALPLQRMLPTDMEKRLNWARKQVVPTFKKLVEAGYADEVWTLLREANLFRQD